MMKKVKRASKPTKLNEKYKKGFLVRITNPKGKRQPLEIFQGSKSGFSARYEKSKRNIAGSSINAESYGRKLAKKGHKRVEFKD